MLTSVHVHFHVLSLKSKCGKSSDFEIGLWSLAGTSFETGATERAKGAPGSEKKTWGRFFFFRQFPWTN